MSTLKEEDFKIMDKLLSDAKGKFIQKDKVLKIIQDKLKEEDFKNTFNVDRIDGVVLKEIHNTISEM